MKNKEYKYIFSQRLAGYLMLQGFRILRINHNLNDDYKNVFVFNNSPEITQAMIDYKQTYNNKE